jgi:integrase
MLNQKDRRIRLIVLPNARLQSINIYHGVAGGVTNFMKTNHYLGKTPRTKKQQREIRSIKLSAIRWGINKLLRNTGIRSTLPRTESNPYPRSGIMMCHGLRKGFEDNAFKAGMPNIYIRRLLGQKSGLEDSYLKISDEELLEGDSKHVGYVGIIDQITIEDTHRLTREIQTLQIEKSKMEQVLERINKLEDEILNQ